MVDSSYRRRSTNLIRTFEAVAAAKATQKLRKLDVLAHLHRVVAT
jgi:hypothetical protein